MKIIYHHRTRAEDAQGVHINEIINAFKNLGHQVEIVGLIQPATDRKGDTKATKISKIASIVPAWIYELLEITYNAYGLIKLRKTIKTFNPDFIYERYALFTFAGVLASRIYKIPLILEVNAPLAYEKSKYTKLFLRGIAGKVEQWVCSSAHRTIVVSTKLKEMLIDAGVPENDLTVVSNGINEDTFNTAVDGSGIRNKYNLKGKVVLGFVGWFREWHGLEDLLRLYVDYRMDRKDIHLLMVGDGPIFRQLNAFAKEWGLLDRFVHFTGAVPREQIPQHIAAFDLALQPDVTDYASPIKLFEYIGMGKGVIAPRKSNIVEILTPDYPGYFNPRNWDDMGAKIFHFASSRDLTTELGAQALSILQKNRYYWLDNARRTVEMVDGSDRIRQ